MSSVKPVIKDFITVPSKYGNTAPCLFCNTNVPNIISLTKPAVQMIEDL